MMARFNTLSRAILAALLLLFLFTGINAQAQTTRATVQAAPDVLRAPPPPDEDPPYNYAGFSSQSVPGTMTAGGVYTVTVSMINTGTTTWSASTSHALGSQNPQDNGTWGGGRVGLAGNVAPGQTATFTFNVTAPANPGSYNFQWKMVQDGVEWFGAPSQNLVINVVAAPRVNNAAVVSQNVPAQMVTGQSYPIMIVMQNTGNTTWTSASQYSLGVPGGRAPLPESIPPGGQANFSVNVTAPAAGNYNFLTQMVQDGVEWFGAASNTPYSVSAPLTNNAAFVGHSVPATMTPGQTYTATVIMQNTGTTTWIAHGDRGLASANPLANNTWNVVRIDQPTTTAPGQTATYTFTVTAPSTPGTYNFQWKMVQDQIEWFGAETPNLVIQVATPGDTVTYIHTDALGSPVARSDSAGNVISRTSYEPYGRTASGVTPTIGFTGHVNDADTGLVYMQQRYYDPVAGRFLSVDPVTTDTKTGSSFNRYAYANNSPRKYIDPDGREAISGEACLGGCIGLTLGLNRLSGEAAITLNLGAGLGGGVSLDPRKGENGRMNVVEGSLPTKNTDKAAGLTVAGYGKATALYGIAAVGAKAGGGKDLVNGQNVGGLSEENSFQKAGIGASVQGGVEISLHVDLPKLFENAKAQINDALNKISPKLN